MRAFAAIMTCSIMSRIQFEKRKKCGEIYGGDNEVIGRPETMC